MFWQKSSFFLSLFFICACHLEALPRRLHLWEFPDLHLSLQSRGVQLFLISESSHHFQRISDHDLDILSRDVCIRSMLQGEFETLFSFEQSQRASVSLVCMRFPTSEEERTGFSTYRLTFVSGQAFSNLVSAEGSMREALRVLSLIKE